MNKVPKSKMFDDVYFSAEDGLAETQHVFLEGNGLPGAWAARDPSSPCGLRRTGEFTIFETGFGTGLNFLAVWDLFEKTAKAGQRLHFISVEKHPLERSEIQDVLEGWDFQNLEEMLVHYPESFENKLVQLSLHLGDVNAVMPGLDYDVDCWFLDGFRPSSNPEMWTDTVFQNMARMSQAGATLATFTAAGFVRRGLQEVGFEVDKAAGFGRKREMLVGRKI